MPAHSGGTVISSLFQRAEQSRYIVNMLPGATLVAIKFIRSWPSEQSSRPWKQKRLQEAVRCYLYQARHATINEHEIICNRTHTPGGLIYIAGNDSRFAPNACIMGCVLSLW